MLLELSAYNIALSHESVIELAPGLTCITGETGAGKSLTLDALNLALGGRADTSLISDGADKAEAAARFSVTAEVRQRLQELDLASENEDEVILRRVLSRDGKNKAYVNGRLSTSTLLRELASCLVSVHGQHAGYKLLQNDYQLTVIDAFGGHAELLAQVQQHCRHYQQLRGHLNELSAAQKDGALRYKSLRYEKELLDKLNLKQGDYEDLIARFDRSMHARQVMESSALAQACLDSDEHNVISILDARRADLEGCCVYEPRLRKICDIFTEALKALENARQELGALNDNLQPENTAVLNERLALCHDLARRFGVEPQYLYEVQQRVEQELHEFLSLRGRIEQATAAVREARALYEESAGRLSQARLQAAARLEAAVSGMLADLAMPDGRFAVKLWVEEGVKPRLQGRDEAAFLFSANPGHELRELSAAASGGELSRLALALEAVTASAKSTPTIVFDEVDTGISGRTASAVGRLLKQLSTRVQVITVTHLPQVAAAADAQYLASKDKQDDGGVVSTLQRLDAEGRVQEIARMMGGTVVTAATLQSARSLLHSQS